MDNTALKFHEPEETAPVISDIPPDRDSLRRHVRAPFIRRRSGLILMLAVSAAGAAAGALIAPEGALLPGGESFLIMFMRRLLPGCVILLAEYICGYFALGAALVWLLPLAGGLGAGLLLSGLCRCGMWEDFFVLLPSLFSCCAALSFGADAARDFSLLLLRLVTGNKNSIVMTSPAAGNYTLRIGACLAVLLLSALYEAAVRLAL